ncbi:YhjD/YihY/BrkB family envelope integrity protein [Thiobacillus sp.]|uniref:YhjD/YihY/BrkB family envelope integrity protein n=1 Tax=Thiobacillus sp. TaxID=924 RepID=UPI0025FA304F|nr:YhjD/YihY/BrkB family envelope integrity protein [Thiobacillus sp.]MBT9539869.1 YihY/virulence factor BrkB family protein [Thiobacillus sp.]
MRFPVLAFLRERLSGPLQLAHTTARLFGRNGLQNHAAAAAFYFLLSATPLLLLLSYALQLLGHIAENSVPATILMAALYDQMRLDNLTALGFIPRQAQLTVGGIGLLTLVLSSRGLVNAVQGAFNVIFPSPDKRNLMLSWVLPLIILPLLFALMGLAMLAQMTLSFLAQNNFIGSGNAQLLQTLNSLFGFAMVWSLLFAAYWRLPRQHPPARTAALFALAATLSLAVLLSLFGTFFKLESLRSLYGAPGSVVFVLMGAYFSFLLLYLWAQALYAHGKADITALEKLFLGNTSGIGRLEAFVFGDPHRLLEKYGETHPAGHTLIEEGSDGRTSYFLHTGRAAVYKRTDEGQHQIGSLNAGQLFGEMAYLLNEKRTASIIAQTNITVLALPPHILEELMTHSAPLSRRIIDTLCQRLQQMILVSSA